MDWKELIQYVTNYLRAAYLHVFRIVCYPTGQLLSSLSPSVSHSFSMHGKTEPHTDFYEI